MGNNGICLFRNFGANIIVTSYSDNQATFSARFLVCARILTCAHAGVVACRKRNNYVSLMRVRVSIPEESMLHPKDSLLAFPSKLKASLVLVAIHTVEVVPDKGFYCSVERSTSNFLVYKF